MQLPFSPHLLLYWFSPKPPFTMVSSTPHTLTPARYSLAPVRVPCLRVDVPLFTILAVGLMFVAGVPEGPVGPVAGGGVIPENREVYLAVAFGLAV